MNEQRYERISSWIRKSDTRFKIFVCIYKVLPYIMMIGYLFCIVATLMTGDFEWGNTGKNVIINLRNNIKSNIRIVKVILVPAAAFGICTIFRRVVNAGRPYEKMNINPLIKKDKKGQSFPSRHTLSAAMIAMTALYVNQCFGIIMLMIAAVIGAIRPIAGVHYVKDVVAGFVIGVAFGMFGFYVI